MHPVVRTIMQSGDSKTYLYKDGDEMSAITGGWEVGASSSTGAQSKEATYLSISANATTASTARRTYVTANTIDLTDFATLNFEIEQTAAETNRYGVYSTKSDKTSSGNVLQSVVNSGDLNTVRTVSIDISAQNGSYYVAVNATATSSAGLITCKVTKVWLE